MRYRLDELDWKQFQCLCQTLLKLEYGTSVEAWGTGQDLGRDAYLRYAESGKIPTPAVFQVKFFEGANAAGARTGATVRAAVAQDIARLRDRLRETGERVSTYCLLTNAQLSGKARESVTHEIAALVRGVREVVFDGNDICAMLDNRPFVRRAYPQLFTLADMEALIEGAVSRALRLHARVKPHQECHLEQGIAAYKKGHVDQALAQWRKTAVRHENSYALHNWVGLALKSKGELSTAMEAFEQATRADPDDPVAYYNWGNCLTMLGRYDEAVALYDRAIALKPDYAGAYGNKAVALCRGGDPAGSFQVEVRALELAPDDANLCHNHASHYMDMAEVHPILRTVVAA